MTEKTILQGLGYMMGFGVPVIELNGDISSTIRIGRGSTSGLPVIREEPSNAWQIFLSNRRVCGGKTSTDPLPILET
jgi:hypothetical protein